MRYTITRFARIVFVISLGQRLQQHASLAQFSILVCRMVILGFLYRSSGELEIVNGHDALVPIIFIDHEFRALINPNHL